jgi:acetolactate synthase regulatory subunit
MASAAVKERKREGMAVRVLRFTDKRCGYVVDVARPDESDAEVASHNNRKVI